MKIRGRIFFKNNFLQGCFVYNHGFSLPEVIISLAIVSLMMLGIYSMIMLSLKVTADNSYIVEATEIANQKMEKIRNLRYDDVGTETGSPHGIVPEYETVERNGTYVVHTMITFYDDPYDGTLAAGNDNVFVDYKIVTIDVSWQGRFGSKKISVFSKVVPNTRETLAGYGLMKLLTVDANGGIMPNANIHIENDSPLLSADYISNEEGEFDVALLPDFEGYEVTVSKTGYSTEKTYARDAVNLNPSKPNLSVYENIVTEESFSIDLLGDFNIKTVANNLQDNWRINASTTNESLNSKIGIDQDDNVYLTWQSNSQFASTVFVQKMNASNVKQWASEIPINSTSAQANPDIAVAKSGQSYVVWQDNSVALKQLAYNTAGNINKLAKNQALTSNNLEEVHPIVLSFFSKIRLFTSKFLKKVLAFGKNEITIQKAEAVSSVSIVQTKISNPVGSSNHITTSFDSSPTPGNVLVAIAVHRNDGRSFSSPTNSAGSFSVSQYSNSAWSLDVGIWHKVAGSGEPSTVTIYANGNIEGGVLMLMEISGLDTSNLLNVSASNDQTSNSSLTAYTGQTNLSLANSFAISASAFADNDFNVPSNASWSSGSLDTWVHRLWTEWSTDNDGSLAVATMDINNAANQSATLTLSGGGTEERNSVLAIFRTVPVNQAIVSASGNQNVSQVVPTADYYLGGKFVIIENSSSRNINSVKLQEHGTVEAQTNISSMKLFYDLDTSAPFDCASESYNSGSDMQFGANATFDGADGFAQITQAGGVNITTTKTLCLYPVATLSGADNNDTLDIRINNPSTDVVVSTGSVIPATSIEISSSTLLNTPADVRQVHARLRNDDGSEASATWIVAQDVSGLIRQNENLRIRFEVTNRGGVASDPMAYLLEYGELAVDCDSISAWQAVSTDNSSVWKITDSANLIDSSSSSNITDGLTDENSIFNPGQLKDTGNQTANLTLGYNQFTEIEYNLTANNGSGDKTFCFRLTDQGDDSEITYEKYAVASVRGDENIYIRGVDTSGNYSWSVKRVNADISDADQINPVIALTESSGVATTTVAWEDNRNGNSDIYLQILDNNGTRVLSSDLQVSSSSNSENSPAVAFDSNHLIYVAWVEETASKDIYLSKFDASGVLLAGPTAFKNSSDQEYSPSLVFDASNNMYLSYTKESGGIKNILVAKYDTSLAQTWEKKPSINSTNLNQSDCSLGIFGSVFYAVWNDERNGESDIYSQKIDSSGNPVWTADLRVNIGLDVANQVSPSLVVRSNLMAFSAWQDKRNNINEIYASEYSDPSALVGVANLPLEIIGTKKIGENPVIYKYNTIQTTDANGNLKLEVDWDAPGYSVMVYSASTTKNIIFRDPPSPLMFLPGESKTMILYVQ